MGFRGGLIGAWPRTTFTQLTRRYSRPMHEVQR